MTTLDTLGTSSRTQYRVKEVVSEGRRWYYPQHKRFLFWRNFEQWYRGVKWMRKWEPFFETREEAEKYVDGQRRGRT